MKITTSILIAVIAASSLAFGQQDKFEAANDAYRDGNYTDAIELYSEILESGPNGMARYNLGNAYYKSGNFTRAILNYEKALKLNPNDKDIRHNLNLANLSVVDKIDARPEFFLLTWWKTLSLKMTANTWTILFLILLWASILSFVIFAFTNIWIRKMLFVTGLGGVFFSAILLLLALTRHQFDTSENAAIITTPSASVKSAPLNSGTDLFIIHEGLKVEIIDREGNWLEIYLADGKEGWIPIEMADAI